ncbi:MAG: porin family protein [Firmicutes bacterium]|nr:porin family protein [Bacillota bacterium]
MTGKRVIGFVVVLFLALTFCVNSAWSYDFINSTQGYDAGVWFNSLYGNVNYGNSLSLRGDLNLKQATGFTADADWKFNDKWSLGANYSYMSTTGDQTINRNTTFNGRPIVRGDRLHSKLTLSTLSFMFNYNIVRNEDSTLNAGVGARYMNLDLNIVKDPSVVAGFNFALRPTASFIPIIGLSGKQRITERIYLFGDFSGMFDVGGNDIKNASLYDFKGGARWNFQEPGWYATFEYRAFGTRLSKNNGDSSNIYWNGPAFTVRYEF